MGEQIGADWETWDSGTWDTDASAEADDTGQREGVCNLQRVYQDLLGEMRLREERIPPGGAGAARGALVLSNLGALSQAIDEYDLLRFRRPPAEKLADFADWLQSEAPLFFEEPGEDAGKGAPLPADAVTVCTIHKAKGRGWPAVFVPGMAEGRFPHNGHTYGRTKWHLLPREALRDAARYETTRAEETRLMYVAMTRAKKFLTCSFAPDPALARPQQASSFLSAFARCPDVLTDHERRPAPRRETDRQQEALPPEREKLPPRARAQDRALVLTFSQISTYLRCPYLFKLRTLYGWAAPPAEAEGYGKGGHDALAEVHAAAIAGRVLEGEPEDLARTLIERHLLLPYASAGAYRALAEAAISQVAAYLKDELARVAGVTHAEMPFEVALEGLIIVGRNDVILWWGGRETLREIKSRREVQSENLSRTQLYIEDLGFHAATGRHVGALEVYNLSGGGEDEAGVQFREAFDVSMSEAVKTRLLQASQAIRLRDLPRLPVFCGTCRRCDHPGLCRDTPQGTDKEQIVQDDWTELDVLGKIASDET